MINRQVQITLEKIGTKYKRKYGKTITVIY